MINFFPYLLTTQSTTVQSINLNLQKHKPKNKVSIQCGEVIRNIYEVRESNHYIEKKNLFPTPLSFPTQINPYKLQKEQTKHEIDDGVLWWN